MSVPGIMIVEDESLVGLDLQNNLDDMGYRVTSVHSEARRAIDSISEETPDLVLMDIQLRGEMDGIDAARVINDRFGIPVLFLTAFADSKVLARAREVGAYGYMIKPFASQELRAMVEVALSKHRTEVETRELKERIQQAQKYESLRLMAGGMAHRFNNSMHAVLGYLSMAMEELPTHSPAVETLKNAHNAATDAADLGTQLLACSGRGFYSAQKVNLTALIEKTLAQLEALLPPLVTLTLDLDQSLPPIQLDPEQLEMLIVALVTNSVEALKDQPGTISIQTSARLVSQNELGTIRTNQFLGAGMYVCLAVVDNGCGMEKETAKKVFDPFFTTKFTGRGLGLAATLGVVQAHSGTVRLTSKTKQGTTVEIFLPAFTGEGSQ